MNMARVEKNAPIEKQIGQVKEEVVREVKHRTRRHRPWLTCSLIILAIMMGVLVWVVWMIAATGLVRIPVFTSLAYEMPEPLREVKPGVPVEMVLEEQFTTTLTRRLYEGGGMLTNRTIETTITEESLTATLRTLLEESGIGWIDPLRSHVIIEPGQGVIIFLPLLKPNNGLQTAISAVFEISAADGVITVVPAHVVVGSARVQDILISVFLKPLLEAELAKVNDLVVGYASISSIGIYSGELVLQGELAVEIQEDL